MKKSRRVNKRKKYTRRFRVRLRRSTKTRKNNHKNAVMKGGLRIDDCKNIGLNYAYRFSSSNYVDHINLLRRYMFGTKLQEDAWMDLLRLCLNKGILVYILTSGNKVGIIRMLQLAALDRYITEVLCTHPEFPVNPLNRGDSPTHNFHGQDKYEVITAIVSELGLTVNSEEPIGYFLDDDEGNFEHSKMCPSIIPVSVLSEGTVPPDFNDGKDLKENDIYKLNVNDLKMTAIDDPEADFNFTPLDKITQITEAVNSGSVRILFLDFDKTLQIHNAAIPFHIERIVDTFSTISQNSLKKSFRINETAQLI